MGVVGRFFSAACTFVREWQSLTPPSPFGERIRSATFIERVTNLWQGYHVTQYERVGGQIAKGRFDNRKQDIYWYPFLLPGRPRSPLIFGGGGYFGPGCWYAKKPVILRIASNRLWSFNSFLYPCFPKGERQNVKILDAWHCSEEWIKSRVEGKRFPDSKTEKFATALAKAKTVFNKV